jgi:hypothetical protein
MSERDEVQVQVDRFCKEAGYTKKSGYWYRRQAETIAVIGLQRSQYSHAYYLNVALWLLPLEESVAPKEHTCHVRTRADRLVLDGEALTNALNLEEHVAERSTTIAAALANTDELLLSCATIAGCRALPGNAVIERSLVRGPAQELIGNAC